MTISVNAASEVLRDAMRDTVKKHSLWFLIQGGLMVLAGIVALVYPVIASVAIVMLLGWLLIISGVLQGISLIGARAVPYFWLQLISVGLSVVIGIMFLGNPAGSLRTITLLLVVFFMIGGIAKVIFALTIKPFPNWGWVLASGIVGILLALWLWNNYPVSGAWFLGLLLGIQLVSEGAALGYLAWRVRQA